MKCCTTRWLRPFEQIAQCRFAARSVEQISLFDLDPGQRAPFFAQPVARPGIFLFMRQMGFAGFDPLFS
jgi:hypothetical protein